MCVAERRDELTLSKRVRKSIVMGLAMAVVFAMGFTGEANATEINAPQNVKAEVVKDTNDIKVTWSAVADATTYKVYRSTKNKKPAKVYKTVTTKYIKDKNLKGPKTYYYWVRANTEEGLSDYSAVAFAKMKQYLTCKIRTVKWLAKTKKTLYLKGKKVKKGAVVKPTKHTKYIKNVGMKRIHIVYRDKNGKKITSGWVKRSSLRSIYGVVSYDKKSKKMLDWPVATKEKYVKNFSSKTNYLIWTNFYTQRVNVFKGKKGKWKLVNTFRCTTGKYGKSTTKSKNLIIRKHKPKRTRYNGRIKMKYYYTHLSYFNGWDAFHTEAWKIPGNQKVKKVMKNGVLNTTGCIRLKVPNAKYIYNNVPTGSRVVNW